MEILGFTEEEWQRVGIICGALVAVLTLIGFIWRWGVRPVWRAAWRTIGRLNQVADELLGDKRLKIPSMTERMTGLEKRMTALESNMNNHLTQHQVANGAPAPRKRV